MRVAGRGELAVAFVRVRVPGDGGEFGLSLRVVACVFDGQAGHGGTSARRHQRGEKPYGGDRAPAVWDGKWRVMYLINSARGNDLFLIDSSA